MKDYERALELAGEFKDDTVTASAAIMAPQLAALHSATILISQALLHAEEQRKILTELLVEAKEDIRAYAVNEHPHADKYPSEARKLENDLDLVLRIEAVLTTKGE